MNKPQIICYIAGKSGGHILPALTLIRRHKLTRQDDRIVLFTTDSELDHKIRQESSLITEHVAIDLENVPNKIMQYPRFLWHVLRVFKQAWRYFRINKPDKIVSLGGYISIPIVLAAYLRRIPIEIYELNVIPGKANLFLARYATTIFICFGASSTYFKRSCSLTAYPIRFNKELREYPQSTMLHELNLSLSKRTILLLGGSQGSIFINNLWRAWVQENTHLHDSLQVIHQTGNQDSFNWKAFYAAKKIDARVFDYTTTVEQYYLATDLVVARAGAGTLFELQFFGKRAIIIPLRTKTTDHQMENAQAMMLQCPYLFTILDQNDCEQDPTNAFKALTDAISQIQPAMQKFYAQQQLH